ncbi:MAG: hypothetical protein J2P54_05145 [Bradyrhizobiaceae bacterium]|nr:hypothetical protein [Bradyrhizobiaceae bacterium]
MATDKTKNLKALLGNYPYPAPLKSGAVKSDRVELEFVESMIREDRMTSRKWRS